jgi:hypothetical protein
MLAAIVCIGRYLASDFHLSGAFQVLTCAVMKQVSDFPQTGYADDGNSAPECAFERAIVAVKMQAVDDAAATATPVILECLTLADAYLDDHVHGICAKMQVLPQTRPD